MIAVSQITSIIHYIIFTTLISTTSSSSSSTADIVIHPQSYSTINGASGSNFNYWDTSYTPPPTQDYQPLSNSLGLLSDGHKELSSTRRSRPSSYVGWYKTPPVLIKFTFNETVVIDKIKISVDDYHAQDDRYCRPYKVLIGRLDYLFPPPPSSRRETHEPYEGVIDLVTRLVDVTEVDIRLYRRCSWMAVSEIEFSRTVGMTKVTPVRYDTANGGTGVLRGDEEVNYWDDSYRIAADGGMAATSMAAVPPPRRSYVFLSGGTGRLTDGYKELKSSHRDVSRSSSSASPYVGWRWAECCQPDISFFFADLVVVEEIRIAVDDPVDQKGDACRPVEAIVGGVRYHFPPNERAEAEGEDALGPYEAVIRLRPRIVERQIRVLLISNCDWVFLSEVEFYAFDSDADGVPDELDDCPNTIPDGSKGAINHYVWNGGRNDDNISSFVTRNGNRMVPSDHYNIKTTKGCSCTQILTIFEKAGRKPTNHQNGCSTSVLNEWIALGFAFATFNNVVNDDNDPPRPNSPPPTTPPPPTKTPTAKPILKPITLPPTLQPITPPPTLPCYPWCDANPTPWFAPRGTSHKCNWINSCAGCSPCINGETIPTASPTKSPIMMGSGPCVNWCRDHDKPWEEKCTWIYSCAGCRECY